MRCVVHPLLAQQTLGGITGEVTDSSGGVIPNATVTAGGRTDLADAHGQTNGSGVYTFVNLPIGTYTLTYTATGFDVQKTPHIAVQADRTATVNASLKVGQTSDTVEVEASPLMNAVDTTVGYVLDKTQIDAVPLATGSFTGLAIQSTGVSAELPGGTGANSGLGNAPIWANGQRDTSNSFSLNGVDASNLFNGKSTSQVASARVINSTGVSDQPAAAAASFPLRPRFTSPSATPFPRRRLKPLQEVRVNASMYDAQQGSTSGAHIDHEHGLGHQSACTAPRTFTAAPAGSMPRPSSSIRIPDIPAYDKVPELHRYTVGGTVGGPIIKDKLFGFLAYQHLHVSDQEIGDSFLDVPVGLNDTDRDAGGFARDFGQQRTLAPLLTAANIDRTPLSCSTRLHFPASPASGSSRTTHLPQPAQHGRISTTRSSPARGGSPQIWPLADLDYNATAKDTLSLKYFYQHDPTLSPYSYSSVPGFTQHLDSGAQVASITNSYLVKTNLSTTQTFGFLREKIWGDNEQPFGPGNIPGGAAGTGSINMFGSNYFPGVSDVQHTGQLSSPPGFPPAYLEYRPQRGMAVGQHRRLPEPPGAFGQRHLDAGQAHARLWRQLLLHAAQHDRQAHRHRHHCHRRLQPDGAGLRDTRQFVDGLLRQFLPAGRRQPLLSRQSTRHLPAGQVPDHANPLAHSGRPLRLGRRADREVWPHLQLRPQGLQLRYRLRHHREIRDSSSPATTPTAPRE